MDGIYICFGLGPAAIQNFGTSNLFIISAENSLVLIISAPPHPSLSLPPFLAITAHKMGKTKEAKAAKVAKPSKVAAAAPALSKAVPASSTEILAKAKVKSSKVSISV